MCNVAPRGIYVCGNNTSTTGVCGVLYVLMILTMINHRNPCFILISMSLFSGLTVSLSRDAATGDYALEAGALVLADQGMKDNRITYTHIVHIYIDTYISLYST